MENISDFQAENPSLSEENGLYLFGYQANNPIFINLLGRFSDEKFFFFLAHYSLNNLIIILLESS